MNRNQNSHSLGPEETTTAATETSVRQRKPKILVVEDEMIVARDIQMQLVDLGYDPVGHTTRGEQAIEMAMALSPDLVLMDVQLSGEIDGIEAAKAIRSRLSLPVVFLTAYAEDDTLSRAKLADPFGYILKPFSERELRTVVEMALFKHHADARLRVSDMAIRAVSQGVLITSANRRVLSVNPAFLSITGFSEAEVIGRTCSFLQGPETDTKTIAAIRTALDRGEEFSSEILNYRKDGAPFWNELTISPVRNEQGTVTHFIGITRDVTARKRAEASLKESEERSRQAWKMEAIGQLAGGVAHDFNNILAVLMMQIELMGLEPFLPEGVKDGLSRMSSAAERGASLTRQLLQFSRKQVMQQVAIDVNGAVARLTDMLQRIIGEDISLHVDLHARPLIAQADAGLLDQVLMNLVINARDAMPKGGTIRLRTQEKVFSEDEARSLTDVRAGRYVSIDVTDSGTGIPPEIISRIFDPFFTTKVQGRGTGLGLSTVFGIVKQHGGAVVVESTVGQGSTFKVFLPASDSDVSSHESGGSILLPRGGSETILLVEDERAVRGLLRSLFNRVGYTVLEAEDGQAAMDLWERHREKIHLLFTDLVMPGGMGGGDLALRLRQDNPGLRVIFTSGYSPELAGSQLALQPGEHYLQKPSSSTHILEVVRRCLDE